MKNKLSEIWRKDGTRSALASVIAILIGLAVGSLLTLVVGLVTSDISGKGIWEGIRLVFFGLFSTGRDAAGALTFGFNPISIGDMLFRATPLIMTGLSVAVAYKTGLFNIGAPGQYLMGTMATLFIALSLPTANVTIPGVNPGSWPPAVVWFLAFLGGMLAGMLWGAIPVCSRAC